MPGGERRLMKTSVQKLRFLYSFGGVKDRSLFQCLSEDLGHMSRAEGSEVFELVPAAGARRDHYSAVWLISRLLNERLSHLFG